MEFKTLIYIIAAIIYLYSRSKKKDKNPTGQTQPEEQGDVDVFDWEETIRKFAGEQPEEKMERPLTDIASAKPQQPQQEVFTYDSGSPRTRDYDEEVISRKSTKDWDTEVLKQKHTRNIEQEAMGRNKAQSLEQQRSVTRPVSMVTHSEEPEEAPARVDLSFEADDLRKGFIYGEVFQPKHF